MNGSNSASSVFTSDSPVGWSREDYPNETCIGHADSDFRVYVSSSTESVRYFEVGAAELIPYECCLSSGALDFWKDESEDIYTSEDGEAV